jgi:hypothetical protein
VQLLIIGGWDSVLNVWHMLWKSARTWQVFYFEIVVDALELRLPGVLGPIALHFAEIGWDTYFLFHATERIAGAI